MLYDLPYGRYQFRDLQTEAVLDTISLNPTAAPSPFDTPIGVPEDEDGNLLPFYLSQAFLLFIEVTGGSECEFSVVFKDGSGTELGTISGETSGGGSFSYSASGIEPIANRTLAEYEAFRDDNAAAMLSEEYENGGGVDFATYSNGAVCILDAFDVFPVLFKVLSPTYALNLPWDATATLTVSGGVSRQITLLVAGVPNSIASLNGEGALTSNKAILSIFGTIGNLWTNPFGALKSPLYDATAWDAYYKIGDEWNHATAPPNGDTAQFQIDDLDDGENTVYVRVTNSDGFIGWTSASATVEGGTMGALSHPDGGFYIPGKTVNGQTPIMRLHQGKAPETLGSVPLKAVHVLRHRDSAMLYAAGVPSGGGGELHVSENEGDDFTMLSTAFPAGFKAIGWCEVDGGRFAAIATQTSGLYGAFFDGQTWSAPKLLYTASSGTPKGTIRQMTGSEETHFIISDAQTYSIQNDDYFETAGQLTTF